MNHTCIGPLTAVTGRLLSFCGEAQPIIRRWPRWLRPDSHRRQRRSASNAWARFPGSDPQRLFQIGAGRTPTPCRRRHLLRGLGLGCGVGTSQLHSTRELRMPLPVSERRRAEVEARGPCRVDSVTVLRPSGLRVRESSVAASSPMSRGNREVGGGSPGGCNGSEVADRLKDRRHHPSEHQHELRPSPQRPCISYAPSDCCSAWPPQAAA